MLGQQRTDTGYGPIEVFPKEVSLSPGGAKKAYRRATGRSGGRVHVKEVTA